MNNNLELVRNIRVETREAKWLYDNLQKGLITVDNSYQRRYVWLEKHKIKLIETILIGYPIPEIYLWTQNIDEKDGDLRYNIIDGQQRLGALQSFINNEFELNEKELEFKNAPYANKTFDHLAKHDLLSIWKYPFSLRFVDNEISKEQIVKMFNRLNSVNMILTPQELRNAKFEGKFIQLTEKISSNDFWKKYAVFTPDEIRRMGDMEFVSTILMFFREGIEEDITQEKLDKIYELYNEVYEEADEDETLFGELIKQCDFLFEKAVNLNIFLNKTNLYTIFTVAYYFLKYKGFQPSHIHKFSDFVQQYQQKDNSDPLITQYKEYLQAQTRSKKNRLGRNKILRTYLES